METMKDIMTWFEKEWMNAQATDDSWRIKEIVIAQKLINEFLEEQVDKGDKFIWLND